MILHRQVALKLLAGPQRLSIVGDSIEGLTLLPNAPLQSYELGRSITSFEVTVRVYSGQGTDKEL